MNGKFKQKLRIAILDLYEGQANEGMRCIRELLYQFGERNNIDIVWDEFEVRMRHEIPDLSYDLYISSGGPGSPLDSEGSAWEEAYFRWLWNVEHYNADVTNTVKKKVLFICHSYQLACRYFKVGHVTKRKSTAFGIFPIHLLKDSAQEAIFEGLNDPFYAVDSRDYQVIQPNHKTVKHMGGTILAIEKERPHVPLERAIMAIRFNENMVGTQFHPEADSIGMTMYLQRDDKKKTIIENYGRKKWESMIDHLNDPDKILWTYSHVIPNFLQTAIEQL